MTDMPERVFACKSESGLGCVIGFNTPSLDYSIEYVSVDLYNTVVAERNLLQEQMDVLEQWGRDDLNAMPEMIDKYTKVYVLRDELVIENNRLRDALVDIAYDCEADYPPSYGAIKHCARAALRTNDKDKPNANL